MFGKLPGLWTGSHNAVLNYRFDITVPIPQASANLQPHEIIPIVAVVCQAYNNSVGVYSHNQDYLHFAIYYLIAPIKDCFNKTEFTSNGYTKYDVVDKKGKRWQCMYTHSYARRLTPEYIDIDPLVRMVSYDGNRYDHLWPGIDTPNVKAINWGIYSDYNPSDPKQFKSYDYYTKMKRLEEQFLSEHPEPSWHVNNSIYERLRNGLLDTSEIIVNGISAYRYYQPFVGSEVHPDAYGIYASGFQQSYSLCMLRSELYEDYAVHCDQNLFYGKGIGYANQVSEPYYVVDYLTKGRVPYGNVANLNFRLPRSNTPPRISSVNWGTNASFVRCGAEYVGWQSPDGLYIGEGTMPYLNTTGKRDWYVTRIRTGYYSGSNVSGHASCSVRGATASAYLPNDIPCVVLSDVPTSWDALYRYSPYYPRAEEQEGENQNE